MSTPVRRINRNDANHDCYDREKPAIADAGRQLSNQNGLVGQAAREQRFKRMPLTLARECVGRDGKNSDEKYPNQAYQTQRVEVSLRVLLQRHQNSDQADHD